MTARPHEKANTTPIIAPIIILLEVGSPIGEASTVPDDGLDITDCVPLGPWLKVAKGEEVPEAAVGVNEGIMDVKIRFSEASVKVPAEAPPLAL